MTLEFSKYSAAISKTPLFRRSGKVTQVYGLIIESAGPDAYIGELCELYTRRQPAPISAEVVGLKNGKTLLMPFGELRGVAIGEKVIATGHGMRIPVGPQLRGRVVDAFGRPIDGRPLSFTHCHSQGAISNPLTRSRIRDVLETGVKSIDTLLTLGRGQRVGIFSGSGVGKSTLLGMIARNVKSDINVIALIGERGREVLDFMDKSLGAEGLGRSVVVVATSDQPALARLRAAQTATSIAEYFRADGQQVTLIMDSLTRFAMAQREIGLAVGEPPTARGYTPSVFALLPRLLERAGTSDSGGSITAIYNVLTENDDLDDPVSDAVRSMLDGHIVLSRDLANQGHFPAIDVLQSSSRLMIDLISKDEWNVIRKFIALSSLYDQNRDLVDIGAYRAGINQELDSAINTMPSLKAFLRQELDVRVSREEAMRTLKNILKG